MKAIVCQRVVSHGQAWGFIGGDQFVPFLTEEAAIRGAAMWEAGEWNVPGLPLINCPPVPETNTQTTEEKEQS